MACLLTTGRTEPCRDAVGGLKAVYFIDFQEDAFTITAGEATALDVGVTAAYKFDLLADGNTFTQPFESSQDNGTSVYTQTLSVVLKKQDTATANELALLVKARPVIVVQDRMDNYFVMGITDGTVATGEIQSGGAKADFNGYNITFTATETAPAPTLDSATTTAFLAVVSATVINP